ncbi:BEND2 protein, partial [Probosciger aterrimus]|nr:BEND2 protein [Probosciger aterrimus]
CQAMYDAIQNLDKKFDLLHRKVSEMQHTRVKPLLLKPVIIRVALQNGHVHVNSTIKHVQQSLQLESQQPVHRQSPPLPTIVSAHSLHSSCTTNKRMPDLSAQSNYVASVVESTVHVASSPVTSSFMPAPSETSLGNNVVVVNYRNAPGSVNISNELPSSSVSISPSFGLKSFVFYAEFLATNFPNYDLSEHGKDWKTCITNVNAMIRCLRSETKINPVSCVKETAERKEKAADAPDTSHCVDLNCNEDREGSSQNFEKMTTTAMLQNLGLERFPEAFHAPSIKKPQSLEPMELLGSPWRNVQLPFSVIYVAKGKSRPELSARYLIRHMFTEDVLVKSNVYGNLERGMSPLDCNRINALRDFLQENYPSFDLKETGYDWKACVAAINSTIRSLRHDHKKATVGI